MDAPLFPGHETTVFFRVTNVSADILSLDTALPLAQITFERIDGVVENPYRGAFNEEFDYRGLADYADVYADEIKKIERKADEVQGIERRMYENTLALMAIFAAIFSLVNINVQAIENELVPSLILVVNLVTVGSFAFLAGAIAFAVKREDRCAWIIPWAMSAVAFIAAWWLC